MSIWSIEKTQLFQQLSEIDTMWPSYTMDVIRMPQNNNTSLKTEKVNFKCAVPVPVKKNGKEVWYLRPMNVSLLNAETMLSQKLQEFFEMCNHVQNTYKPTIHDWRVEEYQNALLSKKFGHLMQKKTLN